MENNVYHSVTLDSDKCLGCTNCIKRCPTEAIRVQKGKAKIIKDRCIDCGECIRVCPHHAKRAVFDYLDDFKGKFKCLIAVPAPALYGQFNNLNDVNFVLTGLQKIGFDRVFEVSRAAEIVSDFTKEFLNNKEKYKIKSPAISSACPAVIRLITVKFPSLIPNILPAFPPAELAAKMAKKEAAAELGLHEEEIGAIFISPCPAKVTAAKAPLGIKKSHIDGCVAISSLYKDLVSVMNKIESPEKFSQSGLEGISWAISGGESDALHREKYLAADGIENCNKILGEIEDGKFPELEFIELNVCTSGCVGGTMNFESPFVAKSRVGRLRRNMPLSCNSIASSGLSGSDVNLNDILVENKAFILSSDRKKAMEMKIQIDEICNGLAGLDCGSCGAPSCKALAEDIVRGHAKESDCIFKLREKLAGVWGDISSFDKYGPNIKNGEK